MAAGMSLFTSYRTAVHFKHTPLPPTSTTTPTLIFSPLEKFRRISTFKRSKQPDLTVCFVVEEKLTAAGLVGRLEDDWTEESGEVREKEISARRVAEKMARTRSERFTTLVAAIMSSFGFASMAVMAVYYRFAWQMEGGEVPYTDMFGTFALAFGAAVGMEFWARWAHGALWHASLWHMHESHHKPREGPFEINDVFTIINAVPSIALTAYGFFNKGLIPGLCFGAGLQMMVVCFREASDAVVMERALVRSAREMYDGVMEKMDQIRTDYSQEIAAMRAELDCLQRTTIEQLASSNLEIQKLREENSNLQNRVSSSETETATALSQQKEIAEALKECQREMVSQKEALFVWCGIHLLLLRVRL